MESINPVDNPVGIQQNSTKAQESQAERRKDLQYGVEVTHRDPTSESSWESQNSLSNVSFGSVNTLVDMSPGNPEDRGPGVCSPRLSV